MKFEVVFFIKSKLEICLISASFWAVCTTKEGSFCLPLLGTGAKYGLSVSMSILSKGINLNVFCNSWEFLKVIIPLAEKYAPKFNKFSANFFDPVKQCVKIFYLSFLYLLKISSVSFSAFLEWIIKGIFSSIDAWICSSKLLIWSFFSLWL